MLFHWQRCHYLFISFAFTKCDIFKLLIVIRLALSSSCAWKLVAKHCKNFSLLFKCWSNFHRHKNHHCTASLNFPLLQVSKKKSSMKESVFHLQLVLIPCDQDSFSQPFLFLSFHTIIFIVSSFRYLVLDFLRGKDFWLSVFRKVLARKAIKLFTLFMLI